MRVRRLKAIAVKEVTADLHVLRDPRSLADCAAHAVHANAPAFGYAVSVLISSMCRSGTTRSRGKPKQPRAISSNSRPRRTSPLHAMFRPIPPREQIAQVIGRPASWGLGGSVGTFRPALERCRLRGRSADHSSMAATITLPPLLSVMRRARGAILFAVTTARSIAIRAQGLDRRSASRST